LSESTGKINLYTAIVFLIFGIAMMMAKERKEDNPEIKK
jgi:hypothetical protein